MTRDEAVEKLEAFTPMVVDDTREALEIAIEALQREEHLVELEAKAVAIIKSERHGEWEKGYRKTANGVDFTVLSCSECDNADPQMNYYDFCPNCGAKMDKEKE